MNRRLVIYIFSALIAASLLLAFYFFLRKPPKIEPPKILEAEKRVIVFKDVKYSGEKGGQSDWEIVAVVARKYLDSPTVEMEQMKGTYKPRGGGVVTFTGSKSVLDTEKEQGHVENVEIVYNNEYKMKSRLLNFEFKAGVASTNAPVEIRSARLTLRGTGLLAQAKEELLRINSNVAGTVESDRGALKFETDRLTYRLKEDLYILEGRVRMVGDQLNVRCDTLFLYAKNGALERLEAKGRVQLQSKRVTARGENAVYYFDEGGASSAKGAKAPGDLGGLRRTQGNR